MATTNVQKGVETFPRLDMMLKDQISRRLDDGTSDELARRIWLGLECSFER